MARAPKADVMRPAIIVPVAAILAATVVGVSVLISRDDGAVARGQVLYDANCAACHGVEFEGQPDWRSPGTDGLYPAPPHDATGHTWHHTDSVLIAYITLGGEAALAEKGVAFDSGMPGFGGILSEAEIAEILDYIKSRWPTRERQFQSERTKADTD